MIVFLNVVPNLNCQIFYIKLNFLSTIQKFFRIIFKFIPTFFHKVMKLISDFYLRLRVSVIIFFVIFNKGDAVVSLNIVKFSTFINNFHFLVSFLVLFHFFIDSVASWNICEFKFALSYNKSLENCPVLMKAS